MKLKEVVIQNFRGYRKKARIRIDDLTALIGKNDVGKSTILEALDTFFNKTKLDSDDINIHAKSTGEEVIIGCVFCDFPKEIILDEVFQTSLEREYLLNAAGDLEVVKKYGASGKESVWIYANHPTNDGYSDLLLKKNSELKSMIRAENLQNQVNLSINAEMRRILWEHLGPDMVLEMRLISADQADAKNLWQKLVPCLPTYRLFKADRPSTDEDSEAQDPMQEAIRIALSEQSATLTQIADEVQRKVSEVADRTIEKLCEFDSDLAATLTPQFKKAPAWDKAFSFSLTGENAIPINKRGSGVRRLLLFSFFRASSESELLCGDNIIYAVEEPETSQHPDFQKVIIKTLLDMVERGNCQVIITTHVPGLAGLLPLSSLRYITNSEGFPEVAYGDDEGILKRIADTLGVLPDLTPALKDSYCDVKLMICVEGPNDIAFLRTISRMAHNADAQIVDINTSPKLVMIPLGGSSLQEWVNQNYLQKLHIPEYHIYDSDNSGAHAKDRDRVNARGDGSSARITQKREMENYIHKDAVREEFNVNLDIDDTMDVSTEISNLIRATNPTGYKPDTVKKKLNHSAAKRMTMERLKERDPGDEVLGWLRDISKILAECDK